MSAQKFATYAAAAMLVVGAIYFVRNSPDVKTTQKAKDVTSTTKGDKLKTTPILTSAVAVVQEPLSSLMAKFRNVASMFLPSLADQARSGNPFGATGGSANTQRAAYTAPLRPEYRSKALAGGPSNVIHLSGNQRTDTNV